MRSAPILALAPLFHTVVLVAACSNDAAPHDVPDVATTTPPSTASTNALATSVGDSHGPVNTEPSTNSATSDSTSSADGPFRLLFRDEFDTFESQYWRAMTHSWNGNLALFSEESALVEDGQLKLRLLAAPSGTESDGEEKLFLGAEIRSKAELTYGRVRARIRFAKAPAVVSSLVTIYTPWPADNWNELDIELLGQDPEEVQFNTMVYTGEPVQPPVTESVQPTADPYMEDLGFDASADFHDYTIEWTPEQATFWVDGQQRYRWTENIHLMTLPQNVLLTIWASDTESWAGAVAPETTGATVTYDWVELWQYTGPPPSATTTTTPSTTTMTATTMPPVESSAPPPTSDSTASSQGANVTTETSGSLALDSSASSEVGASSPSTSESADGFELLFRDDFEELDTARWEVMTHSWDSNLALFGAESVMVNDGCMTLTLLDAPEGTVDDTGAIKSFLGAEVRSKQTLAFGRVKARAKFARGPAVVSSLVTIYTPWPADDWNELDVEHLGATPDQLQFNTMVYLGEPVTTPASTSVTPTQFPELVELGFDASADFHEYEIEWTDSYVRFSVDGDVQHTFTEHVARLGLQQNILLTIWASSSSEWAGAVTSETAFANAVYDWVEVYEKR